MSYPSKGSSYADIKNGTLTTKTDGDKLKLFEEQLKSVVASKIDLKDKNLERETRYFFILNVQDCSPLKSVDDHEELISINEIGRIIKNLGIKKVPGLDYINNKLNKYLKLALSYLKDLAGSYRPLSPTSSLGKLLEKAIADNFSNWAEAGKKFNKQQMVSEKVAAQMIIDLNFLKQLSLVSV